MLTFEEFAADRLPGVLRFAAVLNKSEPADAQAVIITSMKKDPAVGISPPMRKAGLAPGVNVESPTDGRTTLPPEIQACSADRLLLPC